jgi:hypothetical protein
VKVEIAPHEPRFHGLQVRVRPDVGFAQVGESHWLTHTILATHSTSSADKTRSACAGLRYTLFHLYEGPTPAQRHFDALKRMLDRKEPDYAT